MITPAEHIFPPHDDNRSHLMLRWLIPFTLGCWTTLAMVLL